MFRMLRADCLSLMSVVEREDADHNVSQFSASFSPALFVDLQQKIKALERKLESREKDLTSTRAALQKSETELKNYWKEAQLRKREVQALQCKLEEMRKERDLAMAENRRIVNDRKFLTRSLARSRDQLGIVELQRQQEALSRAKVEEEKLKKEREIEEAKDITRMMASTQSSLTSQITLERERRWKLKRAVRDKLKRVEAKETFMKTVLDDHSMTTEAWEDKLAQERGRTEEALNQLERANDLASRLEGALLGKQSAKDQMQYQLRELQNSNKQLREQLEEANRKLFLAETDKKETAKLWRMMHLAQIDANTAAKTAKWEKSSARTDDATDE
ncbi:hypothetical protein FOZ62_007184 [Perkinsus olseni]|uniref:Uncharacterized protein n=1 Tax=Perkinsus olseni TaxID=32597 RepID=A0A7J6Q2M2_PEROL|nr:hypothetical protein FOZ62_007184 [Perkinsus olseni]